VQLVLTWFPTAATTRWREIEQDQFGVILGSPRRPLDAAALAATQPKS
jgi:hypothetical protein